MTEVLKMFMLLSFMVELDKSTLKGKFTQKWKICINCLPSCQFKPV